MESRKSHYNISMSRRTRKPHQHLSMEKEQSFEERENEVMMRRENQKSLKQLIEGRCSLAQHFREEEEIKHQSLVVRPPDHLDGDERLRLKRSMMRNYAQVLSHLLKVKQESYFRSWRKSAISFKLINHK
ncbi:hypothetical protein C2S52_018599 [Perilla frutescens var. hirtella]|nr:hypothetical protein C2S52_018599 [Perilla frutescens var. hirtella]KAH6812279.1 hypothetical protein C2S51_026041 [Perilla frutescens var. frutescens]